ncbi:unnamed protein product [Lactuca virosa]|uniref:Uncharacterized protein n=1 Tax=Lactuca virosa TaxID=75947 RepID=A0AAU9N8E8_9ASTR|nr:unnamed protein product [Lactuca virosa]
MWTSGRRGRGNKSRFCCHYSPPENVRLLVSILAVAELSPPLLYRAAVAVDASPPTAMRHHEGGCDWVLLRITGRRRLDCTHEMKLCL